jgi:hypothetical protein
MVARCPRHPSNRADSCQPCERRAEEIIAAREEPNEDRQRDAEDAYEAWLERCWP